MKLQIDELQSTAITTISSETVSFVTQAGVADAGEIAGVVVYGQLANNKVLNLLGNQMGSKAGTGIASSIVFTTGVMDSTLEIQWDHSGNDMNAQIAAMITAVNAGANGAWACYYPSGLLIVKKKTAGTTQAITSYKVRVSTATLATGDIEIGAVELKNGASDLRAIINAANTARTATDNVLLVQTIGPGGEVSGAEVATPTLANVAASASSVTALAANTARKDAFFWNDSTVTAYLKFGTTASATSCTVKLDPDDFYELPKSKDGKVYLGIITVIHASATGTLRVTELT